MPLSMFHGGTCRCSDKKQSHDLGLTFSKRKGGLGGDQARGKSSVQIHVTGPVAFSSNHLTEILRPANLVIASEVVSECTPSAEAHRYYPCWWCWRFEQMVRVAQAGSRTASPKRLPVCCGFWDEWRPRLSMSRCTPQGFAESARMDDSAVATTSSSVTFILRVRTV